MPPKIKKPRAPPKPRAPRAPRAPIEKTTEVISFQPEQKRTYKEAISDIVKSDYIRNLPQAIAGIIITGLLTTYIMFGRNRTTPTNAENQAIDNLTSNVMHDLFFEEVNSRQVINNLNNGLSQLESKDGDGMWLQFYVDPNKGEWV